MSGLVMVPHLWFLSITRGVPVFTKNRLTTMFIISDVRALTRSTFTDEFELNDIVVNLYDNRTVFRRFT